MCFHLYIYINKLTSTLQCNSSLLNNSSDSRLLGRLEVAQYSDKFFVERRRDLHLWLRLAAPVPRPGLAEALGV